MELQYKVGWGEEHWTEWVGETSDESIGWVVETSNGPIGWVGERSNESRSKRGAHESLTVEWKQAVSLGVERRC